MPETTASAAGGAMAAARFTLNNLIDQSTGDVSVAVLKGLARREALATWGAITPGSLRSALRQFSDMVPELQAAWRQQHGLQVATTMVTPYGRQGLHALRSTF